MHVRASSWQDGALCWHRIGALLQEGDVKRISHGLPNERVAIYLELYFVAFVCLFSDDGTFVKATCKLQAPHWH